MHTRKESYVFAFVTLLISVAAIPVYAADSDNDGIDDAVDVCNNTPAGIAVDAEGRPIGDLDTDCDVDLQDYALFGVNMTGPMEPAPSCNDEILNGDETDIDCGGPTCQPCADGQSCLVPSDCQGLLCVEYICQSPSCTDEILNGDETDIDCGGPTCPPCEDGMSCFEPADCMSMICEYDTCMEPSCMDEVLNGDESDVDCGGPNCPPCIDGMSCYEPADCLSRVCDFDICQEPTCEDGVTNGEETDIDCGGSTCPPCPHMP